MYGDLLISTLDTIKKTNTSTGDNTYETQDAVEVFKTFINKLEGWKTRCKNLHWSAPKKNIHVYLDEFLSILSDYQDSLAEEVMGIYGKFQPNILNGVSCEQLNAIDFIKEVRKDTLSFYEMIPQDTIHKGITSECESFIHNVNKYNYLFGLCDIHLY